MRDSRSGCTVSVRVPRTAAPASMFGPFVITRPMLHAVPAGGRQPDGLQPLPLRVTVLPLFAEMIPEQLPATICSPRWLPAAPKSPGSVTLVAVKVESVLAGKPGLSRDCGFLVTQPNCTQFSVMTETCV